MQAWVEEARALANTAEGLLMHGSTAVKLQCAGGVRRRRVYHGQL